ncbi:MAG: hypothetical protein ABFD54_06040 [Armatimonadota bacterium]|nr:hypothetical protein [bacterium]
MYKMVKCFWCGSENDQRHEVCCVCKRKLRWTTFFKGVLQPTVGCLLGTRLSNVDHKHAEGLRIAS